MLPLEAEVEVEKELFWGRRRRRKCSSHIKQGKETKTSSSEHSFPSVR
jgi:hypothetical protein